MPVRKVPRSARSLTGQLAATKACGVAEFESSLERDWLLQLEHDVAVARYEVQPVRIAYTDETGRRRSYTPDVLVHYGDGRPPTLCEVKHRAELRPVAITDRVTLLHKLRAARLFVQERAWRFRLVTEADARPAARSHAVVGAGVAGTELDAIDDPAWRIACWRLEAIRPLLGVAPRTEAEVRARAAHVGVGVRSLWRWIRQYTRVQRTSALVPRPCGLRPGQSLLAPSVETLVDRTIRAAYLVAERPPTGDAMTAVALACRRAQLPIPAESTVRRRIDRLRRTEPDTVLRSRHGARAARRAAPTPGHFPHADVPHAVVQIDHTKLDVVVVDDLTRRPIGRPWLTLALDVASRMVAGCYVSLDPPGGIAVALCLAHAMLPKDRWLAGLGIPGDLAVWPWAGVMRTVHADNAGEFRADTFRRACEEYGITLEWRPVKRPEYGGHIERLMGTLAADLHTVPGTTFRSPAAKGDYDSDAAACLTLRELERWLVLDLVGVYHRRVHRTLGRSPLAYYTAHAPPVTAADARLADAMRVRLDFLPAEERTAQPDGIVLDGVHYYADVLRPSCIGRSARRDLGRGPVRLRIKRDPRDISVVYVFDAGVDAYGAVEGGVPLGAPLGAHAGVYHPVPYRDRSRPPMSVWELRAAKREARVLAGAERRADEALIFRAHEVLRATAVEAAAATRRARREAQRRRDHAGVHGGMVASRVGSGTPDIVDVAPDVADTEGASGDAGDEPASVEPYPVEPYPADGPTGWRNR